MKVNVLINKFFLLIFTLISFIPQAYSFPGSTDVWQVLRSQFSLNHEVSHPAVQRQIRWLMNHPEYMHNLAKHAEPYIYHIVNEVKKRRLPGEVAIIPMIESEYNPFAYSGAGAAGLWQFMPSTGSELGLKQDWWYDGRRSIDQSTNAALNYLQYLNKFFKGRWDLAIAAYDSGEGTIAKALRAQGRTPYNARFWSLNVPKETQAYIPRLMALAEIIKNPKRYNIQIPSIPYRPYFEAVDVGSQIDLNHAAKLAEIPYTDLIRLNPGHNRWATAPHKPHYLLLPKHKVETFKENLSQVPKEKRVSWERHQVIKGETLGQIALKYHTSSALIKKINHIKQNIIKPNQFLLIPKNNRSEHLAKNKKTQQIAEIDNSTNTRFHRVVHIVQANEDYSTLEKLYRVKSSDIQYWNHLASNDSLPKGAQLVIWKRMTQSPGKYTIKRGDTLGVIAKRYKTSVATLLKNNPSLKPNRLKPGQRLLLA